MTSKHLALILAFTTLLAIGPIGATTSRAQHARGYHRGTVYGRGYGTYRPRPYGYGYGYGDGYRYRYGPRYVVPRSYSDGGYYGGGLYGGSWGHGYSSGYGPYYGSSFYYNGPGYGFSTYGGYCR
jgi:hypothetical protein